MFQKRFFGLVASLALATSSPAQQVYKHNLDITAGGGLQSTQSNPSSHGDNDPRFGWNANFMYRYMFNQHWGIGSGVGVAYYKSKATYNELHITNDLVHVENDQPYQLKADFDDWEEAQRLLDIEVPLAVYYMTPMNDKWSFIADLGAKLMIPVWNRYHVVDGEMERRGFFEEYTNIEYYDLPQHGFGKVHHQYGESELRPVTGAGFVDVGFMRKLKKNRSLYLGAYFSYAFANLSEKMDDKLYDGKNYTGIVSSNLVDKTYPMSAGIKVGLSLGYPKHIDTVRYDDPELIPQKNAIEPPAINYDSIRAAEAEKARQDSIRAAEEKRKEQEQQLQKAQESVKWLNTHLKVNFDLNKAVVEPNEENDKHILYLKSFIDANPDKMLTVIGHTCNLGKEENNIKLGMRRSIALMEIMIQAGIPAANIRCESMGSKQPVAPNNNEVNRRKNRRVEIRIDEVE